MFEIFEASIISENIGAFIRWFYFNTKNFFLKKKYIKYEYFYDLNKNSKHINKISNSLTNNILGIIFICLLSIFLIWVTNRFFLKGT